MIHILKYHSVSALDTAQTSKTSPVVAILLTMLFVLVAGIVMVLYYYKQKVGRKSSSGKWETNDLYYSLRVVNEESILPNWLKDKKEVIFPQQSIERYQQLGNGQYGSVYKGMLNQGQAKYEIIISYKHDYGTI